jgi:tetratricopeptide (TPR) repeat protein
MKRARSRKQEQRQRAVLSSSDSLPAAPPPVSRARKWALRLLAVFVPPLLILCGLEFLLRLVGFGFDPHFFKRASSGGRDCFVANDDFGLRFFPPSLARIPAPVVISAKKTPDSLRIFIFGESAALGDPRPNYGAGCYLESLLAKRFPEAKFEVINTSMTAINSHAILPIAQECARHSGDLWLIYMGNNEMVGPFGAATVFGPRAPPRWLIRAQLQLQRLRLGQLLFEAGQKLRKRQANASGWQGMEMFVQNQVLPDDPRKQRIYGHFERNLQDIVRAGLASGAKLILSTIEVNQKDCPPFGTAPADSLAPDKRSAYEKLLQDGAAAQAQGDFAGARTNFQSAAEIFPQAAEAHFQLATCLLRLTNTAAARPHFTQAVDVDTLPFRADSRINQAIRNTARQFVCDSLALCDAAAALNAAAADGVAGEESFYEHVHLNPHGNYALALAWAEEVIKLVPAALKRNARSTWATEAECEQWLGLTDWNRASIIEEVLRRVQRPPFTAQSGNAQQVARLRNELGELRKHLTSDAAAQARKLYLRAVQRRPENFRVHENYAEFLEAIGELQPAIAQRRKVCELLPHYYFPWYSLAVDLKQAGELVEARDVLLKAAALRPEQGDIQLELGIVCARQTEWESAREHLDAARRLRPGDPSALLYLGEVLWKLQRTDEALATLRDACRLAPSDWQPHYRLASDLAQLGQFARAALEYQEALHLNPASVKTKVGLAAALLNVGRKPEALQQLDEALQLDPNDPKALELRQKFRNM